MIALFFERTMLQSFLYFSFMATKGAIPEVQSSDVTTTLPGEVKHYVNGAVSLSKAVLFCESSGGTDQLLLQHSLFYDL